MTSSHLPLTSVDSTQISGHTPIIVVITLLTSVIHALTSGRVTTISISAKLILACPGSLQRSITRYRLAPASAKISSKRRAKATVPVGTGCG